ncbi:hypothetical protein G0T05_003266 [Salmonella enterica subsp. enterica serovar Bredeney]|nr:hypothetical protein [Salmonella enterica subsp. enterica serovar Bredeney]
MFLTDTAPNIDAHCFSGRDFLILDRISEVKRHLFLADGITLLVPLIYLLIVYSLPFLRPASSRSFFMEY